jgi:hypothetical protein
MASALFSTVGRFTKVLISVVISIINLHKKMLPEHLEESVEDPPQDMHLTMIKSFHVYNNPIAITFGKLLRTKSE